MFSSFMSASFRESEKGLLRLLAYSIIIEHVFFNRRFLEVLIGTFIMIALLNNARIYAERECIKPGFFQRFFRPMHN